MQLMEQLMTEETMPRAKTVIAPPVEPTEEGLEVGLVEDDRIVLDASAIKANPIPDYHALVQENADLKAEIAQLRVKLADAEETLRRLNSGGRMMVSPS